MLLKPYHDKYREGGIPYDSQKEPQILKQLYYYIELRHNFFIPTMGLPSKQKVGKKYKRFYQTKTPYRRVLEDPDIPEFIKETLVEFKKYLDPYCSR